MHDRKADGASLLLTYKQLLDSGAITPKEFARKKAELLPEEPKPYKQWP